MSTTDTGTDTEIEQRPPEEEPAALPPAPDPVRDRLLLPLLLPVLVIAIVVVVAINISRVLLAGGESDISLVVGIVLTVGILGGAAAISAAPRLRTSTLAWMLGGLLVVVMSAGLITIGASQPHGEAEATYEEPGGRPVGTLEVHALPTNEFDMSSYQTVAGVNEVNYVDEGGDHTLVFEESELAGFKLAVPDGPTSLKAELKPGEYTIFCTIPGHRSAGMEATVTAREGPAGGDGQPPPGEAPPPPESQDQSAN
jgi:plastocyanin